MDFASFSRKNVLTFANLSQIDELCTSNKSVIFRLREEKSIKEISMTKETIQIKNLSIGYRSKADVKVVAKDINAAIKSGELTCLLGANGVGKSTLLRTLSAFQPKIKGDIYIEGKEISQYSDKQLSHVISVVLTEKPDIRNLTVDELVGLGRSPYTGFWGTLSREDKAIVERSIALVGITHLHHRAIQTLSDGERQKVMIAKALAQETPVIYLDEPTAFLDYPSKVEMMQLLHQLSRQTDKTIFLSTHDLELALQIADKVWLMDSKNGVSIGTPEDLSLSGELGKFFTRKGISFDMEAGLFRVENDTPYSIHVEGAGTRLSMVSKALYRNGIWAGEDVKTEDYIETDNKQYPSLFILHHQGKTNTYETIDTLLQAVKSTFTA